MSWAQVCRLKCKKTAYGGKHYDQQGMIICTRPLGRIENVALTRRARSSRWNSFPPVTLLPSVLKFWRSFSRSRKTSSINFQYPLPPMKADPRRCNMLAASAIEGVWHHMALPAFLDRRGVFHRNN
jgi:hypothetical protein